jgi:hypothetical protein
MACGRGIKGHLRFSNPKPDLILSYLDLIDSNELKYNRCAEMCKFLSLTVIDKEYKAGWDSLYHYCAIKAPAHDSAYMKYQTSIDSLKKAIASVNTRKAVYIASGQKQQALGLQKKKKTSCKK